MPYPIVDICCHIKPWGTVASWLCHCECKKIGSYDHTISHQISHDSYQIISNPIPLLSQHLSTSPCHPAVGPKSWQMTPRHVQTLDLPSWQWSSDPIFSSRAMGRQGAKGVGYPMLPRPGVPKLKSWRNSNFFGVGFSLCITLGSWVHMYLLLATKGLYISRFFIWVLALGVSLRMVTFQKREWSPYKNTVAISWFGEKLW